MARIDAPNTLTELDYYGPDSASTLPDSAFLSLRGPSGWATSSGFSTPGPILVRIQSKSPREPLPAWFKPTVKKLSSLMNLAQGWDSYDAAVPAANVLKSCLHFLLGHLEDSSIPPEVVPTVDGGVQLEWHQRGIDLEITWIPENEARVYCRTSEEEWEGDLKAERTRLSSVLQSLRD